MSEPDRRWISAHVFHRGDQDLLITRSVAPLCETLTRADRIDGWFFLRYWEGGPHVRVRLRAPGRHVADVSADLARSCRGHLAGHPSPPDRFTEHEYAAAATRYARGERRTEWDRRLHPVDTIEFARYRPEHDAYGRGRAMCAIERHFVESSRIASRLLAEQDPAARCASALAMVMLAVAVCEPDPMSAGARLAGVARPPSPYWASFHRERARDLLEQARLLWTRAAAPSGGPSPDPLAAWLCSVRRLHVTLTSLREQGVFGPVDARSPFAALAHPLHPGDPAVAQVVLRCAHLLCNRLGLRQDIETGLAFLTARTLTELTDDGTPE